MRKSIFTLALGTAIIAVSAAPAMAQDVTDKEFEGVYVGGSVGFDVQGNDVNESILFDTNGDGRFGDSVLTTTGANAFSPGFCNGRANGTAPATVQPTGCRNDRDDISYSGRIGYDLQFGNFVVGAVGEFGRSNISDSVSAFSTTPANYTMTREINYQGAYRVRAGYAANRTLFYVTGGGAVANIKRRFQSSNTANTFTDNDNDLSFGIQGGGGIEQKISKNISFGLEYLYNQYRDDVRVFVGRGTAPATNPFVLVSPNGTTFARSDDDFRWHSVRATVNFRF